jgi:hypothetical protein
VSADFVSSIRAGLVGFVVAFAAVIHFPWTGADRARLSVVCPAPFVLSRSNASAGRVM